MSAWRVIITDTESSTGVAPVCEAKEHPMVARLGELIQDHAGPHVFDCCPHPQIETWSETTAATVALKLTHADADLRS